MLKDVVFGDVWPVVVDTVRVWAEKTPRVFEGKSPTLRVASGGGRVPSLVKADYLHSPKAIEYMNRQVADGRTHWDFAHHSDVRNPKSATVVANFFKGVPYNVLKDWDCIRKFHPVECERLQTLPDNYTQLISIDSHCLICYKNKGNECKDISKCQGCAESQNVKTLSQIKNFNYATNTICVNKDTEQQNESDRWLINPNHVHIKAVKEDNKPFKVIVSCTINGGKNTVRHTCLNENLKQIKSVSTAMIKSEYTDTWECVANITKCGGYTETLPILILNENSQIKDQAILDAGMADSFINTLLKNNSVENYPGENEYIMWIWINLIILKQICSYVKPHQYIQVSTCNLTELQENVLNVELSFLKTGSIKYMSDTARYTMLGNGWTVEVIKHIFECMIGKEAA